MQHLRFLKYLDTVARTGSFRAAAQRMHIAASAIHRRIQDLEEEIGAPLLERGTRGVRLTAEGELFVAYARQQMAQLEAVQQQITELRHQGRGTIKIAISQVLTSGFLAQAIHAFRLEHPRVDFTIKVLDHQAAIQAINSYEVDIGIIYNPPHDHGLHAFNQVRCHIYAVLNSAHPLAHYTHLTISQCTAYPLVLPDHSLAGRQVLENARLISSSALSNVVMQTNSFELMYSYLRHSDAIGFQAFLGHCSPAGLHTIPINDKRLKMGNIYCLAITGRVLPPLTTQWAQMAYSWMTQQTYQA